MSLIVTKLGPQTSASAVLNTVSKTTWPTVFAYLALGTLDFDKFHAMVKTPVFPKSGKDPIQPYTKMPDFPAIMQNYFHPMGSWYPKREIPAKYAAIPDKMLMLAYRLTSPNVATAKAAFTRSASLMKLLTDARMYLSTVKQAGNTYVQMLTAFKAKKWEVIHTALPSTSGLSMALLDAMPDGGNGEPPLTAAEVDAVKADPSKPITLLKVDNLSNADTTGDDWTASTGKNAYGGCVINSAGEVLLREPMNHFDGYVWTFPKGTPDAGETPAQTALREVNEETGYTCSIIAPLPGGYSSGLSKNFYYVMKDTGTKLAKLDGETAKVEWVSMAQAFALISLTTNKQGKARDLAVWAALSKWLTDNPTLIPGATSDKPKTTTTNTTTPLANKFAPLVTSSPVEAYMNEAYPKLKGQWKEVGIEATPLSHAVSYTFGAPMKVGDVLYTFSGSPCTFIGAVYFDADETWRVIYKDSDGEMQDADAIEAEKLVYNGKLTASVPSSAPPKNTAPAVAPVKPAQQETPTFKALTVWKPKDGVGKNVLLIASTSKKALYVELDLTELAEGLSPNEDKLSSFLETYVSSGSGIEGDGLDSSMLYSYTDGGDAFTMTPKTSPSTVLSSDAPLKISKNSVTIEAAGIAKDAKNNWVVVGYEMAEVEWQGKTIEFPTLDVYAQSVFTDGVAAPGSAPSSASQPGKSFYQVVAETIEDAGWGPQYVEYFGNFQSTGESVGNPVGIPEKYKGVNTFGQLATMYFGNLANGVKLNIVYYTQLDDMPALPHAFDTFETLSGSGKCFGYCRIEVFTKSSPTAAVINKLVGFGIFAATAQAKLEASDSEGPFFVHPLPFFMSHIKAKVRPTTYTPPEETPVDLQAAVTQQLQQKGMYEFMSPYLAQLFSMAYDDEYPPTDPGTQTWKSLYKSYDSKNSTVIVGYDTSGAPTESFVQKNQNTNNPQLEGLVAKVTKVLKIWVKTKSPVAAGNVVTKTGTFYAIAVTASDGSSFNNILAINRFNNFWIKSDKPVPTPAMAAPTGASTGDFIDAVTTAMTKDGTAVGKVDKFLDALWTTDDALLKSTSETMQTWTQLKQWYEVGTKVGNEPSVATYWSNDYSPTLPIAGQEFKFPVGGNALVMLGYVSVTVTDKFNSMANGVFVYYKDTDSSGYALAVPFKHFTKVFNPTAEVAIKPAADGTGGTTPKVNSTTANALLNAAIKSAHDSLSYPTPLIAFKSWYAFDENANTTPYLSYKQVLENIQETGTDFKVSMASSLLDSTNLKLGQAFARESDDTIIFTCVGVMFITLFEMEDKSQTIGTARFVCGYSGGKYYTLNWGELAEDLWTASNGDTSLAKADANCKLAPFKVPLKYIAPLGALAEGSTKSSAAIDGAITWLTSKGILSSLKTGDPLAIKIAAIFALGGLAPDSASYWWSNYYNAVKNTGQPDALTSGIQASVAGVTKQPQSATATASFNPPAAPPALQTPEWSDPAVKAIAAKPDPATFVDTKKGVAGGSNVNTIMNGPANTQWLFKQSKDGDAMRLYAESAASTFAGLVTSGVVPCGVVTKDGTSYVIQPMVTKATQVPSEVDNLSNPAKGTLLADHAVSMFLTDHDAHEQNWLQKDGNIIRIDRGQAFKYLVWGGTAMLDPTYTPPGQVGGNYAKKLLIAWGQNKATIPDSAFGVMKGTILAIQNLTDDQIIDAVTPYMETARGKPVGGASLGPKLTAGQQNKVINGIITARDTYLDDWTATLKKLRKDFEWPASALDTGITIAGFASSPKDAGFLPEHEQAIKDAVSAGWQGKSLFIDRDFIENQEVHLKQVAYPDSPDGFATFISFRVNRAGGNAAESQLGTIAVTKAFVPGVANTLPFDSSVAEKPIYGLIKRATKHLNHHLFGYSGTNKKVTTTGDGNVKVTQYLPQLQTMLKDLNDKLSTATSQPDGNFQGVPNQTMQQAMSYYIDWTKTVISAYTDLEAYKKQVMSAASIGEGVIPEYDQFSYTLTTNDVEKLTKGSKTKASPVAVQYMKSQAFQPAGFSSMIGGKAPPVIALNAVDAAQWSHAGTVGQYRISVPAIAGCRLYYTPVSSKSGDSEVRSYFGQAWGIIPGAATPASVAAILKAFEIATGLSLKASTPVDRDVLFMSKQAFMLQGVNGPINPQDAEGAVNSDYVDALNTYRQGDAATALAKLRKFVAKNLTTELGHPVTPDGLESLPNFNQYVYSSKGGAGYFRPLRLGWTVDMLKKTLGNNICVGHRLAQSAVTFWDNVTQRNGCLFSSPAKMINTVPLPAASIGGESGAGSSASSDLVQGAAGVFCVLSKGFNKTAGHLYFAPDLLLRTDTYVIGTGDTFGNNQAARYTSPLQWAKYVKSAPSISSSSSFQLNVRHDIDLRRYLYVAFLGSASEKNQIISLVKSRWGNDVAFANGRTPEEVFRLTSENVT